MTDAQQAETLQLLQDTLKKARGFGATDADIILSDATSVSVARRLGQPESIARSEEAEIGLRVFVGRQQAIVSTSDRRPQALFDMAERAVAMARAVPADPWCGIADPAQIAQSVPALDLYDPTTLTMEQMADLADAAEASAMAVAGVSNSDGAEASYGSDITYFAATNGFVGSYASSGFSLSVSVIAGSGTAMETDYAFDSSVYFSDLKDPAGIGREAGERAAQALNPRKGGTRMMPIVLDRRISGSISGALAAAVSGSAVAKGTTMLKDRMGQQVFSPAVTIVDDPFLPRGARSRPFDDEGLAPQKRNLVENGRLNGWLLDLGSARQLGLQSTGNASRGASSPPSPRAANLYMQNGAHTLDSLIADIDEGFYVTQFLGSGGSILTGDYSRGAKGFWIEKGRIAFPVSEMTIAGNLRDMFMAATPANDLEIKYGNDAPSLRIDGMTVAGG